MAVIHQIDDVFVTHQVTTPTPPRRRWGVEPIALGIGVITAVISPASPTGLPAFDVLEVAGASAALVWFGARARTWARTVWGATAVVLASGLLWQLLALAALAGVAISTRRRTSAPMKGLIVGLAIPAMATQGVGPFATGSSTLLAAAAAIPLLVTGWHRTSRRRRRRLRQAALGAMAAVLLASTVAGAMAWSARPSLIAGLDHAEEAIDHARAGELRSAANSFEDAATTWNRAERRLSGPWMLPSRAVPIVGQHVRSSQIAAGQASAMAEAASAVIGRADERPIVRDGGIDPIALGSIQPALRALADTATTASDKLDSSGSPWLLPMVAERLDEARATVEPAADLLSAGADGLDAAAYLFTADESNVVLAFSTPAEARAGGGFIGSWAHLRIERGVLTLAAVDRSKDLNDALAEAGATIDASTFPEFDRRYGRFGVERHIQDVALHPHGPTNSAVAASLYEQATGVAPDAVIVVDPFVFDVVLSFTGPIRVGDLDVNATNASDLLLRDQYRLFADDEGGRERVLAALVDDGLKALLESPPDPLAFASELAPLARRGHVRVWMPGPSEADALSRLGIDGAFAEAPAGGDVLALTHQNAGQNKIDAWLDRRLDIDSAIVDTLDGPALRHTVTATLTNLADLGADPPLPDAVIGSNDQGLSAGTNRMTVSLYSTLGLHSFSVDDATRSVEADDEGGLSVYSTVVAIGPGESTVVRWTLERPVAAADQQVPVMIFARPTARPDQLRWTSDDTVVFDGPVEQNIEATIGALG